MLLLEIDLLATVADDFKLIVGLGNPGSKYELTRHNAGFLAIDKYLSEHFPNCRWQNKWDAEFTKVQIKDSEVIFLKPQSFMNLSGIPTRACMQFYKFTPQQIIVIHDEADLEEGDVRLKKGGGAGGHNGLLSLFEHLGTQDFYRVRVGVGKSSTKQLADYVLEKTSKNKLLDLATKSSNVLQAVFDHGFIKAQNNINAQKTPAS